jgi:hypothetical protein
MLAVLGWNPGTPQEIFSLEELVNEFTLQRVGNAGAKFDFDKTKWFNQQYLRAKDNSQLAAELQTILKNNNLEVDNNYAKRVCNELKERATFVFDMWNEGKYFFESPKKYDEKTIRKKWKAETPMRLLELKERLKSIVDFRSDKIEQIFKDFFNAFSNLWIVSSFPIISAILNKEGPIPIPVKASLNTGNNCPMPILFSSKKSLNICSILSDLKSTMLFNLSFNSNNLIGVSAFHFLRIVFSSYFLGDSKKYFPSFHISKTKVALSFNSLHTLLA